MVWASNYVTPAGPALNFVSSAAAGAANPLKLVFAPTGVPSGAFDSTALTGAFLTIDNGKDPSDPAYLESTVTVTGTGGAANITITADPSDISTGTAPLTSVGFSTGNYTIGATDGTTPLCVARGRWNFANLS